MATRSRIPISDPKRATLELAPELTGAFTRFLDTGRYIHGAEHRGFEADFAEYLGSKHCVAVASGTDALELSLLAVGCRHGDEVIVAANCGGYASTAARRIGLAVRFADIDPLTLSLSPEVVEQAIGPATRAIVVTHLYGLVGHIEQMVALGRAAGIAIVEDCAQAAGARLGGRSAGTYGDISAFSFYPTKNLAALGDGGAVTTSRDELAERVRVLRQYGWGTKYQIDLTDGQNSRLDEIQAAILRIRMPYLDAANARRRRVVERYSEALPKRVGRFVASSGDDYVAHLAVIVANDRDRLRNELARASIETDVHYPIPDHRQPAWSDEYRALSLPVTEDAAERVVTVPCFPELTEDEIERVCEALGDL